MDLRSGRTYTPNVRAPATANAHAQVAHVVETPDTPPNLPLAPPPTRRQSASSLPGHDSDAEEVVVERRNRIDLRDLVGIQRLHLGLPVVGEAGRVNHAELASPVSQGESGSSLFDSESDSEEGLNVIGAARPFISAGVPREGEAGPVNHAGVRQTDLQLPGTLETLLPNESGEQPEFARFGQMWEPARPHSEIFANQAEREQPGRSEQQFRDRLNRFPSDYPVASLFLRGVQLANGYRLPTNIEVSDFYAGSASNSDRVRSIIRSFYPSERPPPTTFMIIDRPSDRAFGPIRVLRFGGTYDGIPASDLTLPYSG